MNAAALKERLSPYISLPLAGATFGGLTAVSLLAIAVLAFTSSEKNLDLNVTIPLGSESTVEELGEPMTAGDLQSGDTTAGSHVPAVPVEEPKKKYRPPIEDAVAGLHESTPFGMVPITRKSDGLTAFKAYQSSFEAAPDSRALVSLVMVDFGLAKKISDAALEKLPEGVTFALSPYSDEGQTWTTSARQQGHEVWLSLPVQGQNYGASDSGNQTLLVNASLDQNKSRMLTTLGKATGYVGVIDMDTPGFSSASADLDRIYTSLIERGLGLVQANPKDTVTGEFAIRHKAPFIQNDLWIDENATPEAVTAQLEKLKNLASNGQVAVGFFSPYPSVIEAVAKWQKTLAADKIELAPLSAAIEQK